VRVAAAGLLLLSILLLALSCENELLQRVEILEATLACYETLVPQLYATAVALETECVD
jgi:hypothetical protein